MSGQKQRFGELSRKASTCRLCPAMADLPAILGWKNGVLSADLIFVAEAPGRFGSGRTGIPFHGDRPGDNFESLLRYAGLTRKDVFITNAVLCNPLNNGNNRRPTAKEIFNCSSFLKEVIDIISPRMVTTLGSVGLDAINRLWGTHYQLTESVARPLSVSHFTLFPLYHPSPHVVHTRRSIQQQKLNFKKLAKILADLAP